MQTTTGGCSGKGAGLIFLSLLLHGDSSPFIPVNVMVDMHHAIPNSRIQVFPKAKHGLPFSHASECATALRHFLDALSRR